jgi:hypothetical protein
MKALRIFLLLFAGVVGVGAITFFGDAVFDRWFVVGKGPVSGNIRRAVLVDGAKSLDMAKLTSFDWSSLSLYSPYQFREQICSREKLEWTDCRRVPPSIDEGEVLLLFRTTQGDVYMERHDRREGDFANSGGPRPVVPAKAVFEVLVEQSSLGNGWYRLRWLP